MAKLIWLSWHFYLILLKYIGMLDDEIWVICLYSKYIAQYNINVFWIKFLIEKLMLNKAKTKYGYYW